MPIRNLGDQQEVSTVWKCCGSMGVCAVRGNNLLGRGVSVLPVVPHCSLRCKWCFYSNIEIQPPFSISMSDCLTVVGKMELMWSVSSDPHPLCLVGRVAGTAWEWLPALLCTEGAPAPAPGCWQCLWDLCLCCGLREAAASRAFRINSFIAPSRPSDM